MSRENGIKPGCGQYLALLIKVSDTKNFMDMQNAMHAATLHRESCPACIALNAPLEEKLFGSNVVIVEESHATN